jgi:hypothetical protein
MERAAIENAAQDGSDWVLAAIVIARASEQLDHC